MTLLEFIEMVSGITQIFVHVYENSTTGSTKKDFNNWIGKIIKGFIRYQEPYI